ncbi:unnamed protein product [Linum tenue]|uniref:Uncharacterized protein n=1 Tax=Linum tenue TaxID=586396 RepID=A0AAV0QUZ7_9ROSI|nr:unnamed protein product [Linum tenue]
MFICAVEILGIKYLLPSYLDPNLGVEDLVTGVCFASAGSGYDRETPKILGALPVPYQLKLFKQYVKKLRTLVGEQRSDDIIKNSLYVISLGNNDVGLTYFLRKKKSDMASYSSFLVSQASATLRQLYGLGVRNIVHLSTIVTGCVPASRTLFGGVRRQCNDESNELAMMYNKKLSNEIERLNNDVRLPNSSIVFVDVYYPLFNMIRYPENYGFAITKKACCGTGTVEFGILCNPLAPTCTNISKYIFWDGVHPTEKTYKIIFSKIGKSVDKLLRKQL